MVDKGRVRLLVLLVAPTSKKDLNPQRPHEKRTSMPSLSLGLVAEGNAGAGVDHGGLLDDETILGQTLDVAAAVGQRDLVDLVGVEPDLALTALEDVGREALLELERHLLFW